MAPPNTRSTFFDGDEHGVIADEPAHEIVVDGLGKARVGHRYADPRGFETFRRHERGLQAGAEAQDGDILTFDDDPAATDGENPPRSG